MIKKLILTSNHPFIKELRTSIKNIEIEERFDLVFSRPLGLLFTRMAIWLKLTPLFVSIVSMIFGVLAGILFYWQDHLFIVLMACLFLIIAGVLDSTDGQLARLTNQSSKIGMIVDGAIDNVVFMAVYVGACIYLLPQYGLIILILGIISGACHSIQSLMYDYQKNEFSFYIGNKTQYRNPTVDEVKKTAGTPKGFWAKCLNWVYIDYVRKQNFFNTRTPIVKEKFEQFAQNPKTRSLFLEKFKTAYTPLLSGWALFGGTNTHRTLIMICCCLKHFEYYLMINILMIIPIIMISIKQKHIDAQFVKNF